MPNPDRNKKCEVIVDELRAPVIKQMYEKVAYDGWSGRKLFKWLTHDIRFRTRNGKPLTLSNIYIILKSSFYYGTFEYPKGSGQWYKGKHEPLLTKELFDQVQEKITSDHMVHSQDKEFAFTKMITCGLCGSGVTADEKFKKQKNGNIHRHVYYGCTKRRDLNCKCGYINEEDLIKQFEGLIDRIDLDEMGMKGQIEKEVLRFKKFQRLVIGHMEKIEVGEIDIRNYAKFILKEGSMLEKRELLGCFRNKVQLAQKAVIIAPN